MKSKVFLLSLGCPRNLVDSEVLTGLLEKRGFSFVEDINRAETIIINTCGFIKSAKEESIDAIMQAASLDKFLIVTGCLAQRHAAQLKKEIPEIDAIFGTSDFIKIPEFIENKRPGCSIEKTPSFLYDHTFKRKLITPKHFAYVKIQEGCRNNCSYCVIPKLKGSYRSRDLNSVASEIIGLKKKGVKEINLIGQDISLYGIEKYGKVSLEKLLQKLSGIMKDGWIRLLYTHPAHYTDRLIDTIASEKPVCKYLDIPIQHISDNILRKMNRHITKAGIIALINKLRKKIPNLAIRTTVMIGFPGETEKEFNELLSFIKEAEFEKLGAFIYSREEGTKACKFPKQLPEDIKKSRYDAILKAQQEISKKKNKSFLGKVFKVLIEEKNKNQYLARTAMDAPEVDGICYVNSEKILEEGSFQKVRITDALEYDLAGEII